MALEFKTGEKYADALDNVYKFIGEVDKVAYFLNSLGGIATRLPSGAVTGSGTDNYDIVTHIRRKVKRKGFAYLFDKPITTSSGFVLYGIIGKNKNDAVGFGNAFNVSHNDSVIAVELDHEEGNGLS